MVPGSSPGGGVAQVAELVDALGLGSSELIRGGSSPLLGTIMKKHTNYIIEYDNFVDDEKINEILTICKKYVKGNRLLPSERTKNRYNDAHYLALFRENPVVSYLEKECNRIGYLALEQYKKDCPLIKYSIMKEYPFLSNFVYRYYNTNDHYKWHVDKTHHGVELKVSFLLYLNDNFEGGNTMFLSDRLKFTPKRGSVLMFPCGPYFIHKSSPIKSGEKHIIWNCYGQRANPGV